MARPGELFLMARVPAEVRESLMRPLVDHGLDTLLGERLSPPRNWHQTLSSLYPRDRRDAIRKACTGLGIPAFMLQLDRLQSVRGRPPRVLWMYVPGAGAPDGLTALLAALRARLRQQNLAEVPGFRAHVTVSYDAPREIAPLDVVPVDWHVDAIELVEAAGHGPAYRYDVVDVFPLGAPAAPPPTQLGLLG